MTDILMPALSPTMEEGSLARWLVKVGDKVRAGDVIAEIETDKATMEVEAVDDGVMSSILVPEGSEGVKVNTPIARLDGEGGAAPASTPPAPKLASAPPTPAPEPPAVAASHTRREEGESRILASPLARRLAGQLGIDLASIKGSGPNGRIVRRDIEAQPQAPSTTPVAGAPAVPSAAPALGDRTLEQMGVAPGSYDLKPLDGMKKTIARRMTESFRDVPHFPLTIDIEIDALLAAREKINRALNAEAKVSVNDMVIKAAAAALMRVPAANASYT